MPAGTSALGHDAFKILRNTNLMRMQQNDGEKITNKHYRHMREEMAGRKKAFDESVNDYKLSLVRARERKRKIQGDQSEYWHQQMDWKKDRKEEDWRQTQYDPDTMWNVEEPTRRKNLYEKKINDQMTNFRNMTEQGAADRQRRADNRQQQLKEERQVVDNDLAAKELETNIHAFKRQLFAQEMLATWEKQNRYKKNMKIVEDEC